MYAVQLVNGNNTRYHTYSCPATLFPLAAVLSSYVCSSVYRLLTSPFVHGGLLHIAFNMLAFVPIGCSLERTMGTLALAHLIGLLIFLGAGIYIGLAMAAAAAAFRYMVQL